MNPTIGIIGVGYVGLSLAKTFSKKYDVIAFDISKERINLLKDTKSLSSHNIIFTNNENVLKVCEVYIIAVPTNIDENKQVNLSHLYSVKQTIKKFLKPNDMIIIESSIYVGGTREILGDLLKDNISICMSPERISPGTHEDANTIPKIVSGLNKSSLEPIQSLYDSVFKIIVPVSSCEVAEMCKLYENCFRVVNIAYVNEIADLCKLNNINVGEVIAASSTKPFGFMSFYPGFGVGGSCLPQNPYFLMNNLENPEQTMPILNTSINILENRSRKRAFEINHDNILFIGIGFKPNQTLTLFSPALDLYNELIKLKKKVFLYDPLLNINQDFDFSIDNLLKFDCIIIGNKMDCLDYKIINLYKQQKEVIDC
jgi:nucleotide sugar dehydrogenase